MHQHVSLRVLAVFSVLQQTSYQKRCFSRFYIKLSLYTYLEKKSTLWLCSTVVVHTASSELYLTVVLLQPEGHTCSVNDIAMFPSGL